MSADKQKYGYSIFKQHIWTFPTGKLLLVVVNIYL